MPSKGENYIVVTVPSIIRRDKLIKEIYTNLTKEPSYKYTVTKDQVNRIKIFHNVGPGVKVLIRTYVVLVIPVQIDLKQLDTFFGEVDFHLDETIQELILLVNRLQKLQGKRTVKERKSGASFKQLVNQLSGVNG